MMRDANRIASSSEIGRNLRIVLRNVLQLQNKSAQITNLVVLK
ncbi:hypothetical protein EDWATA_00644 [Edwardsiella tarda ATCC 23685]|uniref:Uncharacterized protein n=1 Tax=Edwardsiella tarda ATCC 23685 TaxID=500638 RepID=D4F1Q1_EDWTA|nr:hypothetical protein EDWATA_00644 [Edwardsiella tarda ATCC 23685]